jgi:hypothetical protein
MAQSTLTVTTPSPTPPTNMSCTGATPPNVPNYTKATMADWYDNTKFDTAPPPYFDDGAAGALYTFAANTAALASGTGATAGGTENSYPGAANGVVPASTSVPHEGAGTEVLVTVTYPPAYTGAAPHIPLLMDSCGPVQTAATIAAGPNATHASSMSPVNNPALASLTPATAAAAASGSQGLTVTGTNFTPGCRIWVNGVERPTTFISLTSMSTTFSKVGSVAGAIWAVDVKLGGVPVPSTKNFTWT